jgi:histone H3/H4
MKMNDDVHNVSADAILCVSRATELFIDFIANNCLEISLANNRKSIKVNNYKYIYTYIYI